MMHRQRVFRRWALGALALSCWLGMVAKGSGQSLTWLGTYDGYAEVHGVSADGTTVVGWAGITETHIAFRWTPNAGWQVMGSLVPGEDAEAWGMSADGQVVVGYGNLSGTIYRGFRWQNGVFTRFGTFGGSTSWAWATNQDGSVVVGAAQLSDGFNRAFRWTQATGMVNLGTLPGGIRSVARGVSLDGNVVVGWSGDGSGIHRAWRWENGTMTSVHNPHFGQSEAIGVSGNGQVVVGAWGDPSFTPARPFRWTSATGMQDLGTLGGAWGEAWGENDDGSILVGWSEASQGNWHAFRWTSSGGMEDLNVAYANQLTDGSVLRWAATISPDGRYIAGNGTRSDGRYEAFLLDTGPRCTAHDGDVDNNGCIDDADLMAVVFAFGDTGGDLGRADVNCDGVIDDSDLIQVVFNFGNGC